MKRYRIALLCSVSVFILQQSTLQGQQIIVGQLMPDVMLHNIQYYPQKQASLKDFRGKWLLLDFWDKGCGACIAGFPSVNRIQQELKDSLQVMLVAGQDKENLNIPVYKRFREKERLVIPSAFDSDMIKLCVDGGFPNAILIDDKGIVQCWTINMSLAEVRSFMAGQPLDLPAASDYQKKKMPYDSEKPFLVDNNGAKGDDFIFRSVLSRWDRNKHYGSQLEKIDSNLAVTGKLEILGATVEMLYELAYWGTWGCIHPEDTLRYGKIYNRIVLKLKDTGVFNGISASRYNKNLFSYSLILPKENRSVESMQQAMREDLKRYFGYEVTVGTKKCPCYKLVAGPDANKLLHTLKKIPTGKVFYKSGFINNDIPFDRIVNYIRENVDTYIDDATGISGNVNFDMDCIPNDINDLQKALKRNGLELISAEKNMKVITIKNSSQEN